MEFRKPKPKSDGASEWVNCSNKSILSDSESQYFTAGDKCEWVDCSKRTKYSHSETSQRSQIDTATSESSSCYHLQKSLEISEKTTCVQDKDEDDYNDVENAQNSIGILNIIPESSNCIEFVRKMTKDVISTAVEENIVKKLLKPYVDKHKVTASTLNAEGDKSVLKKSIGFASLSIMVTALMNEKGPRPEAPFFIRSLCHDIIRSTHIIMDDITEEISVIIGNAASLIANMVQKDLEPALNRGYSLEDIGIVALVENVIDCILDSARISQFGGGRNNFVHNVIKNLIPSDEIRKIILNSLCLAIKRSYCLFYATFEDINISTVIIPPAEINGLFHYFQLLTMVILCSSEEPWMEETEVEKIKELETIALTKLPMCLIISYASRTAVYAMKYQKTSPENTES